MKCARAASDLIESDGFKTLMESALRRVYDNHQAFPNQPLITIAHSRLVTNGRAELPQNNQPVRWGDVTMVHNGIIVNVDQLWDLHSHLARHAEVDTEVLAALVADAMAQNFNSALATQRAFAFVDGAASIAWLHARSAALTLATNTGDLYCAHLPENSGLVFASERFILQSSLKALSLNGKMDVEPLTAGSGLCLSLNTRSPAYRFHIDNPQSVQNCEFPALPSAVRQNDVAAEEPIRSFTILPRKVNESLLRYNEQTMRSIRRCTCCVLPETFPFIEFDEQGVCNYCRNYKPKFKGLNPEKAKKEFVQLLEKYRTSDNSPDVLVPLSGGRDSCYGLHLIKREFGMNPITFTYDWGMVTDLARRNIARICGKLGVQNILVSADIKEKRDNIRKNIIAWLKKPDLGMVPLFMAGDKHFFKIVNDLKSQTGIRLDLWSANPLENTDFKAGFCGVPPDFDKSRVDYLSLSRKIRLALYYMTRFAANPSYLNKSLLDTAEAFLSYYVEPRHDFFFMFHHIVWNEAAVNDTIIGEYSFERSPDSPSTWRIGDGTAPFYNYIYATARGFTEFDTFRSNQIREGQITRDQAMDSILAENRPRVESLRWYLDVVGLDFNETVMRINALDTMGLHR